MCVQMYVYTLQYSPRETEYFHASQIGGHKGEKLWLTIQNKTKQTEQTLR